MFAAANTPTCLSLRARHLLSLMACGLWLSAGCAAGERGPSDDVGDTTVEDSDQDTDQDSGEAEPQVAGVDSLLGVRDYGALYWPTNFRNGSGDYQAIRHVQTGFYGIVLDVKRGDLSAFGELVDEVSPEAAMAQGSEVVASLPTASVGYSVVLDGPEQAATGFFGTGGDADNPSRVIDMGRFMQRVDIPEVKYSGDNRLSGSVQLAAMTRHFVLTHRAASSQGGPMTLRIEIEGDAVSRFDETEWLDGSRAVSVRDADGQGWSFVIPEQAGATPMLTRLSNGGLLFEMKYESVTPNEPVSLSVIAIPAGAATDAQLPVWVHPEETVKVQSAQLARDGSGGEVLTDAAWDAERGLFLISLRDLSEVGAPTWADWTDSSQHTWYNRHRLRVDNLTENPVAVPMAFEGGNNAAFYIVGGSPLFRDENLEPTGAPIQISKNWHETPFWYHLYSALELPAGVHEYELTFAHSKWGEAYAAAHSQLSLVGWGTNQQWDESSLGAFGESVTYDPDLTLGRAMVDDVRPFLVDTGKKWHWTGNVGGADFLTYIDSNGADQRLGRLRTHYAYTGPNLTNVSYSGVSADGKVEARISTQLGRTDDLIRVYYHVEYTFLEDVSYDRLALFQVAADGYADNGFRRYAYGDESAVIFDGEVPEHGTTGYASETERGIALTGESPWGLMYSSDKDEGALPEHLANVAFVVRAYDAQIGDVQTTTPHLNLVRTYNGKESQMAFELGVPYDASAPIVPAGSVITATVEYLVPPAVKESYYGRADYLVAMDSDDFQSTNMALRLAGGNHLEVTASEGTVVRSSPVELMAASGTTAVAFTLTGGLGYTPVIIHGLARPDGWRLERLEGEEWVRVDQSVEGNDYWQAYDNSASSTYDLIFNVHNRGTLSYRLVRDSLGE